MGKDEQGSGRSFRPKAETEVSGLCEDALRGPHFCPAKGPPKTQRQRFWVGKEEQGSEGKATSGSLTGTDFATTKRAAQWALPLGEPRHVRPVSGRRAPLCQCILSPLFSKKWLYGHGSTHGCFRLKLSAAALLHVAFVRFRCGYVNLFCHNAETKTGPRRHPAPAQPSAALPPYGCGVPPAGKRCRWGKDEQGSGKTGPRPKPNAVVLGGKGGARERREGDHRKPDRNGLCDDANERPRKKTPSRTICSPPYPPPNRSPASAGSVWKRGAAK